ncbi:hypothetical protein BgAZ_103190 [Babesia gibsoni]|uniref:GYF domain-containing protein n=1 Tax=Babesia gibsoni TaxID=33632 RepID=A0AAD8PFD4_BABGI|nr:hypothetical protein BgAZ_103190 [Babesia gibsoni]
MELGECCGRRTTALNRMLKWYYQDERSNIYGPVSSFNLVYYIYCNFFEETTPFTFSVDSNYRRHPFVHLVKSLRTLETDFLKHSKEVFVCSHYMSQLIDSEKDAVDPDIRLLEQSCDPATAPPKVVSSTVCTSTELYVCSIKGLKRKYGSANGKPSDEDSTTDHMSCISNEDDVEDQSDEEEDDHRTNYHKVALQSDLDVNVTIGIHHEGNTALPQNALTGMCPDGTLSRDNIHHNYSPLEGNGLRKSSDKKADDDSCGPECVPGAGKSVAPNGIYDHDDDELGNDRQDANNQSPGQVGSKQAHISPEKGSEGGDVDDMLTLSPIRIIPPELPKEATENGFPFKGPGIFAHKSCNLDERSHYNGEDEGSDRAAIFNGYHKSNSCGNYHDTHLPFSFQDYKGDNIGSQQSSYRLNMDTDSHRNGFNTSGSRGGSGDRPGTVERSGMMEVHQMLIKQRMQSNLLEAKAHLARVPSRKVSHVIAQTNRAMPM